MTHLRWLYWLHLVLLLATLAIVAGCSDADTARRVLHAQGFHDVKITGHRWFGCSKDDYVSTGFSAVTTGGAPITGVVCSGWWGKSSTVRFD